MQRSPTVAQISGRDLAGRQVATGVYHYRLASGDLSQTRSMVLLK